ncbi:hypothetical protein [Anatilimnocola floriformis]|uniref:hypothetical protein n=1 Tax=Anatilimnocola floriformis TaxID=2948575 RepID=UPI0020C3AC47|nr:hypothetical protein [Anatilimnocola floriformis]
MTKTLKRKAVRFDAAAVKAGKAKIPTHALRFEASVAIGETPAANGTVPITVVARSGNPVDHWYFGRIVHDFSGMRKASAQLPFDYCHDEKEVLGFADKVDISTGELVVSGVLIPDAKNDRTSKVINKANHGFQWQASIYFDPQELVLEFIPEGFTSAVNGGNVEGPIVIARDWMIRGNAICPYGQDPNTSVQFSASQPGDLVAVTFSDSSTMTKKTKLSGTKPQPNRHARRQAAALSAKGGKPKKPTALSAGKNGKPKTKFEASEDDEDEEGKQAADDETDEADDSDDEADEEDCDCPDGEECDCDESSEEEPVDEMDSDEEEGQQNATKHTAKKGGKTKLSAKGKTKLTPAAAEVKKFVTAFGPQGGVWFSEGKTFAQAQTLFTTGLQQENATLKKKVSSQETALSALRGEETPVSGGEAKPAAKQMNGLSDGQSKFAATIKLPK